MKDRRVLFCVTGSIAAYRVCDVISELRKREVQVRAMMTRHALEFITPLTLSSLTGHKVYRELFDEPEEGLVHTSLADFADLIVVMPATANFIARLACGFADDLPSSVILASRAKVLLVPAMNDQMYQNPMTQKNLKTLRETGFEFEGPIEGHLACGRRGVGHIASQESILRKILTLIGNA
ncbi:MAG TPA: flavoprotein [Candidatus Omnitrophota bacterium]|nr:flavoprotein [Candidatus Omnitrophota bacterium]